MNNLVANDTTGQLPYTSSSAMRMNTDDGIRRGYVPHAQVGLASLQGKARITELIARLRAEKLARKANAAPVLSGQSQEIK